MRRALTLPPPKIPLDHKAESGEARVAGRPSRSTGRCIGPGKRLDLPEDLDNHIRAFNEVPCDALKGK